MSDGKSRYGMEMNEARRFLGQHMIPDWLDVVLDLERSRGSIFHDGASGRDFVDLFGFFGSQALGFNHPRLREPQVERDLLDAARHKPSNSDVISLPMARFVDRFSRYSMPEVLPHLFLISGGALAVENAMKAAFDWKTRHNADRGRPAAGSRILHFRQAFHGRSGYTLSVTNTDPVKIHSFPKFDWPRVSTPKILWPLEGDNLATVEEAERRCQQEIVEAFVRHGHEIAAILIEPIQGEGGDNYFRPEFFECLRRIAVEQDVLLIYDEVQCGFGTTGKWWAWQHDGVAPDLLCFGKKAQVCGVLASRRLEEVEHHVFARSGRINSTWGGNLVDMVRSGHIIDAIVEEGLLAHVAAMGERARQRLHSMETAHPGLLAQIRGRGGMIAFDLPSAELRDQARRQAFEQGVLVLGCGERSLRFRPALSIAPAELDEGLDRLEKALSALG